MFLEILSLFSYKKKKIGTYTHAVSFLLEIIIIYGAGNSLAVHENYYSKLISTQYWRFSFIYLTTCDVYFDLAGFDLLHKTPRT